MALRMPISRVRSATDTSIIFIIPIDPTNSDTAAIATNSIVIYPVTVSIASITCFISIIWKSSASSSDSLWRSRSRAVICSIASALSAPSFNFSAIILTEFGKRLPCRRFFSVVIGMMTISSWLPIVESPRSLVTPIIVNGIFCTRIISPTGLVGIFSSSAVCGPIIAYVEALRTADWLKKVPYSISIFCTCSYPGYAPTIDVAQF